MEQFEDLLRQVSRVYDLDREVDEVLEIIPHNAGNDRISNQHIHDLHRLKIQGERFIAKAEDVLEDLHLLSVNYHNFASFALSLFSFSESVTPYWNYRKILPSGEIVAKKFVYWQILSQQALLRSIKESDSPSSLAEGDIRLLFEIYQQRKKDLLSIDQKYHERIFCLNARDIVNEVLASIFAQILKVQVPRNFFAKKIRKYTRPQGENGEESLRFVISRCVGDNFPACTLLHCLDELLPRDSRLDILYRLVTHWHYGNPFYYEGREKILSQEKREQRKEIRDIIRSSFQNYQDMIYSDMLDHLFSASRDRKIQEFLTPGKLDGPIFTVDYGDVFFVELSFASDHPLYLKQKELELSKIEHYFQDVLADTGRREYRRGLEEFLARASTVSADFLEELILGIAPEYFISRQDCPEPAYRRETLLDYLKAVFQLSGKYA